MSRNFRHRKKSASVKAVSTIRKRRSQAQRNRRSTLEKLEDSENITALHKVAADGTTDAHKVAVETLSEIIYVHADKVVRKSKNGKQQVIQKLSPRKVVKGTTTVLKGRKARELK
jgi:hypothetical protein